MSNRSNTYTKSAQLKKNCRFLDNRVLDIKGLLKRGPLIFGEKATEVAHTNICVLIRTYALHGQIQVAQIRRLQQILIAAII
ncbi:hypothetical protein KC365_g92 [Hortaea werneckii]|nr:hypothetical protein KC365_g92 [Hortaea werneckii]